MVVISETIVAETSQERWRCKTMKHDPAESSAKQIGTTDTEIHGVAISWSLAWAGRAAQRVCRAGPRGAPALAVTAQELEGAQVGPYSCHLTVPRRNFVANPMGSSLSRTTPRPAILPPLIQPSRSPHSLIEPRISILRRSLRNM